MPKFFFADHVLDTDCRELNRGDLRVPVEPQVFDVLEYLLDHRHRVVSKDDLIEAVWSGRIVSDSTLTSRINAARKAIGDTGFDQKLIRTVPRKGFRFVGAVIANETRPENAAPLAAGQASSQACANCLSTTGPCGAELTACSSN